MFKKLLLILLSCSAFLAHAEKFVAGEDYIELTTSIPPSNSKPTVVEYFSFGCPACFNLEKTLSNWVQTHKNNVLFSRVPVVFHSEWEVYAKAYYTADALSLLPGASEKLFEAVQVKRTPLQNNNEMIDFFVKEFKTNPEMTKSAFEQSPSIDLKVKDGMVKAAQLEINRIPAFIVNDRFKTDLGMAKNPERLIAILDELVKKSTHKVR